MLASYLLVFSFFPCHHFHLCVFSFPRILKWNQRSFSIHISENLLKTCNENSKLKHKLIMSKVLTVLPLRNYLALFETSYTVFQEKKTSIKLTIPRRVLKTGMF